MATEILAEKAVANVLNESRKAGTEPPAVITDIGATDGPYDAGNLPETTTQPTLNLFRDKRVQAQWKIHTIKAMLQVRTLDWIKSGQAR